MFVKTIKVKNLGYVGAGVLVLILAVVLFITLHGSADNEKYKMSTETERTLFLESLGWETSGEYTDCRIVVIPQKFNDVYEGYNDLQKEQGFNLSRFKGKTVEIYTYELLNYPNHPENMVANLIVLDGTLIGGDVCCLDLDGFMHGLMMPNSSDKN